METPFKAVEFNKHDTVTRDLLDTVQGNNQWLRDNTPRGQFYNEHGPVTDTLTTLVGGRVHIPRSKKSPSVVKKVRLGRAFAPRCHPNVTTGIVSEHAKQIFCVVNGPDGRLLPNSTGFEIKIHAEDAEGMVRQENKKRKKWQISKGFFVYWQAMGYRTDDMNEF